MKTMKALSFLPGAIALMLAASPMIPAFTNPAFADPGQMGGRGMEQLNLTADQQAKMKQIHEATRQQMDAILTPEQKKQMQTDREQHQKPNLNLTEDQKAKMEAIRKNAQSQMDAILTAEQKQKIQELQASRGAGEMPGKELNLTEAQQAQMKQIHEATRQQMDAILTAQQKAQMEAARQQGQRPNLNLSQDQKAKMEAIRKNAESQMEAILTPEQKQKLQELRQQRSQRRQQQQSN
jgi:protein CpxP